MSDHAQISRSGSEGVKQWLLRLRFSASEAYTYTSNLSAQGFDDIQAICEDAELEDFHSARMLPGHARRLHKASLYARHYASSQPTSPNSTYNSELPIPRPRPHSSSDAPYFSNRTNTPSPFFAISEMRAGLGDFVPEMSEARLRGLASQLGMPIDVLLDVFGEEATKARIHLGGGVSSSKTLKPAKPISRSRSGNLVNNVKISKLSMTKLKRGKSDSERSVAASPETVLGPTRGRTSSREKYIQIALGTTTTSSSSRNNNNKEKATG